MRRQQVPSLLRNSPYCIEHGGALPHSQKPATCSYREPDQSSPYIPRNPTNFKIHFNMVLPSTPGSSRWLFPSDFPTKILCVPLLSPLRATYPAHLILLYLIARILFGQELKRAVWQRNGYLAVRNLRPRLKSR